MKSIIKRVLVGVLVALILSFIRGNLLIGVSAKALYSHWAGSSRYFLSAPSTSPYIAGLYIPIGGQPFKNSGYGYINFSFATSSSIASYAPGTPFEVLTDYGVQTACNISTTSQTGDVNFQTPYDTFNNSTYTAVCPVYITNDNYLKGFNVRFLFPGNGEMTIQTSNVVTFYRFDDNVENALNNQTNNIINNQNQNSQNEIEAQKVCKTYDVNNATTNGYLDPNGIFVTPSSDKNITNYININGATIKVLSIDTTYSNPSACFYNSNKDLISCIRNNSMVANSELTIPSGSTYVRFTINTDLKKPTFEICQNGNTAISNSQDEINNTLNNDDTSTAQSKGNNFFSNFQSDSHGLSGIITAPLRLLNSFTTATCQPLNFQLPIVHNSVSLPCMKGIYEDKFGVFFSLWQLITTGLISYNVCINLYSKVRNLQNPRNDRIEVLNL